jgi:hypothetical protein
VLRAALYAFCGSVAGGRAPAKWELKSARYPLLSVVFWRVNEGRAGIGKGELYRAAPSPPRSPLNDDMGRRARSKHLVSAAALLPASPVRAYATIADCRDEHPRILPRRFNGMTVEGGIGAGTTVRFRMTVLGRKQTFRAAITEPEPGRVRVETDLETNGLAPGEGPRGPKAPMFLVQTNVLRMW